MRRGSFWAKPPRREEAQLRLDNEGRTQWDWGPVDEQDLYRVTALLHQGLNPNQIARKLGISKSKAIDCRSGP